MKTRNATLFLLLTALLLAIGCSAFNHGPKATAVKFANLVIDKKYDEAARMIALDKNQQTDDAYKKLGLMIKAGVEQEEKTTHRRLVSVKGVSEEITGDDAKVTLEYTYSDGKTKQESGSLKKIDGEWKVSLKDK